MSNNLKNGVWTLFSPMPGMVIEVPVKVGDQVQEGSPLIIIEAMKMQNPIESRVAGEVSAIHIKKGQRVYTKDLLVEVKTEGWTEHLLAPA